MNASDFRENDRVVSVKGLTGTVVDVITELKYSHHIMWYNGYDDWYADKIFRKGEIKKLIQEGKK